MPWLDMLAVLVIVGWACAFLLKRWRRQPRAEGGCGRCDNADCDAH